MPQKHPTGARPICHVGAPALAFALVAAPGSALFAGNGLQWRLNAHVPVLCAILEVETPADRPASLAVATSCNAQRYQLILHDGATPTALRAAHSSAGPVQISGSTVTITSTRPGYALTTIELTAPPTGAGQIAVILQPV